jgi:Ala-tRNA(Pro) deacylase
MSDRTVLEAIRYLLHGAGVEFIEKQHEPTLTSADSARARGESLSVGAKALVMKTDEQYRLFVLPADRKADSQAIKRALGSKKMRFASPAELLELTGLAPGSVPPFGPPVLPLELWADPVLCEQPKIAFNAGSLTTSIIMSADDYRRVCNARWLGFSQAAE